MLGNDDKDTISGPNELAGVLGDQDKYEEAEKIQRGVVESYKKKHPIDFDSLSLGLNNLGYLLQMRAKYHEALEIYEAISFHDNDLRTISHGVLSALKNIGVLWSDQGFGIQAEEYDQEVVDRLTNNHMEGHPKMLIAITSLRRVFNVQKRYTKAEKLHLEARKGLEETLGKGHPTTFSIVNALALNLHAQERNKRQFP